MADILVLIQNFVVLFMESAPWLLLGLLVAGIMHELVPVSFLERHMGSNTASSIAKAAVIGAPLPLCSCGVIPAALGLRRSGASKSSTVSFLVSTPETGVDSVSVSYALLGPLFAVVRPVAAIMSAIYAGFMVRWFDTQTPSNAESGAKASSCCSHNASVPEPVQPVQTENCCANEKPAASCCESTPVVKTNKVVNVLQYASGKLLEDIVKWLLIGLILAAAIKTWVPTDFLTQWGDGLVAMLVMAVIGIPMYICATASTPLAVGFLSAGLSPGAVLVFLMAGPATNVSTMGMIKQEMGMKTLCLYLFSVVSASIGFGYLVNIMVDAFSLQHLIQIQSNIHTHGANVQALYALCAILLGALMLRIGILAIHAKIQTKKQTSTNCCG